MRLLIALFMSLPLLFGQAAEPAGQAKPEEKKEAAAGEKQAEAAPAAAAAEPAFNGSLEVGYRATTTAGNQNVYRSVVNLGDGPKLFETDFTVQDPKRRLFDRLDVHANNWGGDPYNTVFANARKQALYDFRGSYRNIAYFNFLPSFANPFLERGVLFSERTFDTKSRITQVELDLFPGRLLVPYFAYGRNSQYGTGITTFVDTGNEYPVSTNLNSHLDNFRGGLRVEARRWHVTLEQGATTLDDDQRVFFSGINRGNNTTPFLGQTLFLTNVNEKYNISGTGIYNRGLVTGNPFKWLDIYGQFLYSQPETDTKFTGNATGQFVQFNPILFFSAQTFAVTGTAKLPHTAASGGFVMRPFSRLRIFESLQTNRLHSAGSALLLQTLLVNGNQPLPPEALADRLIFNYNREEVNALFDVTRRIMVRGGYRYEWGDAGVGPSDLLPNGQTGKLRRNVGLAGFNIRIARKLTANADYEGASASHVFFRPSLADYQLGRVRVSFQALPSLNIGYNFKILNNQNPDPTVKYDFQSYANTVSAQWSPNGSRRVAVLGEYTYANVRSNLSFLMPQDLTPALSVYKENDHTGNALVDLALPGYAGFTPRLSFGGSLFISGGTRPTSFYQPLARVVAPIHKHVAIAASWFYYGFGERDFQFEAFRAHLFQIGLRFSR